MKLLSAILFATLAVFAAAQGIFIRYPPAHKYIHGNQHLTVQVVQPDSIIGPIIVGLAIGIGSCTKTVPCLPPNVSVGDIELYTGPFKPQLHQQDPSAGFYQNFTVYIPSGLPKGKAQLNVALAGLIGAGNSLLWESNSQTLNVV